MLFEGEEEEGECPDQRRAGVIPGHPSDKDCRLSLEKEDVFLSHLDALQVQHDLREGLPFQEKGEGAGLAWLQLEAVQEAVLGAVHADHGQLKAVFGLVTREGRDRQPGVLLHQEADQRQRGPQPSQLAIALVDLCPVEAQVG